MRPYLIDIDPANANLTGFASNVTGASFTLTANNSGDSLAHRVSIRNDAVTDHSGKTVTLVGTDPDGIALTEVVTGPAGSATVESSGYFLTLTSATPSATIGADTFDIGWVDEVSTKTLPLNYRNTEAAMYSVDVTGTINYTVQETLNQIHILTAPSQSSSWHAVTALASKTADLMESGQVNATAMRLVVNSYTDTAEIQLTVMQNEDI